MKRFLSVLLVVAMMLSCVTVFADTKGAKDMENALLTVKQKIAVPEELSEFSPYSYEYEGGASYSFEWYNEDRTKQLSVSADEKGRITQYSFYDGNLKSTKRLTKLSKKEIIALGEAFLKKIVPDAFADPDDCLVYNDELWNVNSNSYNMSFLRQRHGVEVKGNNASVQIMMYDDVSHIRTAYINYDYDSKFETAESKSADMKDIEAKYKKAFPIELIYTDEYQYYYARNEEENKVLLLYRHKDNEAGYISPDGAIVKEDEKESGIRGMGASAMNYAAEESAADSMNFKVMLTEQEIKELKEVEGLISEKEAIEILRKLPYVSFTDGMKHVYNSVRKADDEYRVYMEFGNDDADYLSVGFDGKTNEVLNLSRGYKRTQRENNELTQAEIDAAKKKIDEFLTVVAADKMKEFREVKAENYSRNVEKRFERIVNDVRYINDTVSVRFDGINGLICDYNLDYEKKEFTSAENVVGEEKAYDAMLSYAPIKPIYIMNDGVLKLCYTVSEMVRIDASTGEKYNERYTSEIMNYEYSDVEGHWAEEKINKLAEVQIGLEGEKFNPDEPITQYDLLRLFGAGVRYRSYLEWNEDELYSSLIEEEIITETEKNPEGNVLREDAFVYMVKLDGLNNVAKLSDIFRVEYEDGNMISDGKIGYPAILTGMGIICGNGGKVRPKDEMTRAEAAVMVYNYMMKK